MSNNIIKNVPKTMRAMVLTGHGGMERYQFHTDWPMPQMMSEQVLIKVHACGLNNTDVNTRTGWYSKAVSEVVSLQRILKESTRYLPQYLPMKK